MFSGDKRDVGVCSSLKLTGFLFVEPPENSPRGIAGPQGWEELGTRDTNSALLPLTPCDAPSHSFGPVLFP
jgi:hypothetical protein